MHGMKMLVLLLALASAGCAIVEPGDQVWFKEGATSSERDAALAAAQTQARQAHVQPPEERDILLRAMTAQGWRLVPKESAPPLETKPRKPAPPPPRSNAGLL